jgi:hypothetical protein
MITNLRVRNGLLRTIPHIAMIAFAAGCVSAAPVVAAPASPEESAALKAALVGTCEVTKTQKAGDEPKDAKGIHMTFEEGGALRYRIESPFGVVKNDNRYQLEGRNIKSDGIYKAMRADVWNGKTLKLFVYDVSQTYYCTKE